MTGTPLFQNSFSPSCTGKRNPTNSVSPFVSLTHSLTHNSLSLSSISVTAPSQSPIRSFSVAAPSPAPLRLSRHLRLRRCLRRCHEDKKHCLLVFFLILSSSVLFRSSLFSYSSNSDKIDPLPQQPEVKFNQYSGYITVDEIQKRFLFYYFVEAEVQPSLKPVVMWLHGGPGCGLGDFQDHGPFKSVWPKTTTARTKWFTIFSHYKNNEFFIKGESYTGHFAPQLAALILQTKTNINLKGAIGNPHLEFNTDYNSMGQFLGSHGLITYSTYELVTKVCNGSRITREYRSGTVTSSCVEVIDRLNREVGSYIDDFDVSQDMCRPLGQHIWTPPHGEKKKAFCLEDKIFNYLNKKGVQKALHIRISSWQTFGAIWYDSKSIENSTISLLGTLVKSGVRVMVFSGDQDSVIPFFSTQFLLDKLAKDLGLHVWPYRPWYNRIKDLHRCMVTLYHLPPLEEPVILAHIRNQKKHICYLKHF